MLSASSPTRPLTHQDDPLSAVDSHVGEHLMNKAILRAMGRRTRVLITNQLQFLPQCDRVVVMDKGAIAFVGTYEELQRSGPDLTGIAKREEEEEEETPADAAQVEVAVGAPPRLERQRTYSINRKCVPLGPLWGER